MPGRAGQWIAWARATGVSSAWLSPCGEVARSRNKQVRMLLHSRSRGGSVDSRDLLQEIGCNQTRGFWMVTGLRRRLRGSVIKRDYASWR
jgi:hypothetical protein